VGFSSTLSTTAFLLCPLLWNRHNSNFYLAFLSTCLFSLLLRQFFVCRRVIESCGVEMAVGWCVQRTFSVLGERLGKSSYRQATEVPTLAAEYLYRLFIEKVD